MKRLLTAATASLALASAPVVGKGPAALVTRYTPAQLGGIAALLRYAVARPDRAETRYVFLTAPRPEALPEEVQVVGADGEDVRLADVEGADCTLAHVEVVTGRRPAVVRAARIVAARLEDNVQSEPAAMTIQLFRPRMGGDVGESAVVLVAFGRPTRTAPLCERTAVRKAMLAAAAAGG